MANGMRRSPPLKVEDELKDMRIGNSDEETLDTITLDTRGEGHASPVSQSPVIMGKHSQSPAESEEDRKEIIGGDITVKLEPGQQMPKLVRSSTQKVKPREPPLFDQLPSATDEATNSFQLMTRCSYSPKYLGDTEHGMECDCPEEWDPAAKVNQACGEESDCINRATKIECYGDCGCGPLCQNQRFQKQQYAKVSVIRTEKKGHGLRADADLQAGEFIYEYIGEVIHEAQFRKRMMQYDDEGIKHFYFMSLNRGEFVDATKKGNLGRFCNHSCNPNCYVDKWVVGDKLRMGIFAERKIRAGEELVFNYNVDRYGADPQPCYCGEPNCTGFIGGKTQTERGSKLSNATIEALGIDDGDGWDTAVAKRPRKKKVSEDDEEYVNNVQPRSLDEDGVTKVMAALMQCKEKWIAVKLLGRIQRSEEERVINRVVKMHGYQILNSALSTWKEDFNVVLQILDILNRFPRLTKNKITDSKIEVTVENLQGCGDDRVESQATALLQEWSTLETGYRIPRKKRDQATAGEMQTHYDRREGGREEKGRRSKSRSRSRSGSRSRTLDAPKGPSAAPTGPRNNQPQRAYFPGTRPPFRTPRPFGTLPSGWFAAASNGRTYYYNGRGETTWQRPTAPATEPPPPPKPTPASKALDDIINEITSAKTKTPEKPSSSSGTPKAATEETKLEKKDGTEKWRTLSEEKQRKLYENTLFPHVKHVADKYKHKLPREDIKRFFKEVTKKLVSSDYKNSRVKDPTKINEKQEKNVKKYAKEYFDKAVAKKAEHDKRRAEKQANQKQTSTTSTTPHESQIGQDDESDNEGRMNLSDDEANKDYPPSATTPITPLEQNVGNDGLKRKRESRSDGVQIEDAERTPNKRARSITPPAPPPPPPPVDILPDHEETIDSLKDSILDPGPENLVFPFNRGSPSINRAFDVSFKAGQSMLNGDVSLDHGGDTSKDLENRTLLIEEQ